MRSSGHVDERAAKASLSARSTSHLPSQVVQEFVSRRQTTLQTGRPSFSSTTAIMSHLNKIAPNSPSRQNPSEIETSIANALYELENNIQDMRASLRPLQFVSAREVRSSTT